MSKTAAEESSRALPTILVADDEELNRDLVRRQLRRNYRVLMAEDGAQALEMLESEAIDLALLDVMMPEIDGYQLCAKIKERSTDGFLPVILLTALNRQEDRREGFEAGADDFLSKPVNGHELRLRVQAFLRIREQDRTIRGQYADLSRLQSLKDDLISLIVHDLRNPLTGLQGFLQILERRVQEPGFHQLASYVHKSAASAQKFRDILEEVLDVRLLEEGELPTRPEEVVLGDLAADAVSTVEGAAETGRVKLDLQVEGRPVGRLDRRLTCRALENLLANAIRYAPKDSTVDVHVGEVPGGVEIRVADRGPGVPEPLKEELFKKFGSVEARSVGERRGFGLGLYLVQLVMQAHRGRATVSDREGGGAVFGLFFPPAREERAVTTDLYAGITEQPVGC